MYDAITIGELLIDFASLSADADGYPTMAANPGGAVGNYIAALAQYGMKTAIIGKVGTDAFGKMLIGSMRKAGVDTVGIVEDETVFTTLAFVTFDSKGDRSFSFARKPGADTCLRFEEIDLSLIENTRVFHFGTLSLTDEPSRTATQKTVAYAKQLGKLITFDPNLRLSLWPSPEAAKEQILWGLSNSDIVKISDEEVEFLWGLGEREGADRLLNDYGVKLAMVTLGPKGCYLKNRNAEVNLPNPTANTIDTTGAGDIFGGSAVSRILKLNKQPEDLTEEELRSVALFAATAASLSTERRGGMSSILPEEEVLKAIR